MKIWIWTLTSVSFVSLASLCGILTLLWDKSKLRKISLFLVSVAVGALFSGAILHLIPESFERIEPRKVSFLILGGIFLFFILEKFIRWRHCHIADLERHPHPVVPMSLLGDGMHNLLDGMLIAAAYQVDFSSGLVTTTAVLIHEVPQEIADFGVLLWGGLSVKQALLWNFLSSLLALLGALTVLYFPFFHSLSLYIMPLTAGCFLYIAGADLVPELHHSTDFKTSLLQLLGILTGTFVIAFL